jgi:hypothetical protein
MIKPVNDFQRGERQKEVSERYRRNYIRIFGTPEEKKKLEELEHQESLMADHELEDLGIYDVTAGC